MPNVIMYKGRPDSIENFDASDNLDPFEDGHHEMTAEEREKFEKWQREELARAARVAAGDIADLKSEMRDAGIDLADYVRDNAHSTEDAQKLCDLLGVNYYTHDDEKLRAMRAGKARAAVRRFGLAARLKVTARRGDSTAKTSATFGAPAVDLEKWARDYVAELAAKMPAKTRKLNASLEFQLSQLATAPDVEVWQERARRAFDAKVVQA